MNFGFIGLGKMGLAMVARLRERGVNVVAWNRSPEPRAKAASLGANVVDDVPGVAAALAPPRMIWLMVKAGDAVDAVLDDLLEVLGPGDIVIDGGNSHYRDSIRRAERSARSGVFFLDCGTSGGLAGARTGACLIVGGEGAAVRAATPFFEALALPDGFRHIGPAGAGHFVKMVHNGIEYAMLQAYAEGFELVSEGPYDIDLAGLADVWQQGSVIRSWILELAAQAFAADPRLERLPPVIGGGESGAWSLVEAIERHVPMPALTGALFARMHSTEHGEFAARVVAALRQQFGGHIPPRSAD